ncbi:RING finger protein 151 [Poecilia latipinna]|uniref:Ring finger protein 41, like n=1 Tax=Poecilia latipinna TaxID=48699 RepID=A0A3B3U5Q2_9TELE|nr:PREDICTED: RING finger protein 151-like [Poecilia formosa]XP_014885242.1 PREDICTED: RING finger protein 151-like [Poecilia latipinna]XP_014885250.1 PREDICTED: RING finger protein 151-like [Poecilia latipinna]XP_014885259.1 PREDICTED: RING finger protein 151-like [Poecilia latipinna]XP_016528962.1 PREDICTED: RING finger protein 151-like [Poecilia formosa]
MGFDLERFVGYVNDGLLCCVCRDVLERPLQAPCEHAYCSACISSWLLHHHSCPEDRLPLDVSSLRPLYRYMRNDLNRLQIRCVNAGQGCEVVCSLESLHSHEDECEFSFIACSNTGCPVQVERRGLEAHLSECNFRSRECPNGCGHTLHSIDQSQHNCVAELRLEVDMMRAEMLCKVEEVRREMESRLDSQRRHMVQKESQLKSEVEELKGQLSRVVCDMRALLGAERLRRQELAEVELEKRELLELLRDIQPTRSQPPAEQAGGDHQPAEDQQTSSWEAHADPPRHQQREASLHASCLSLHSAQAPCAAGPPASPQLGEGVRKGGTRSLTLDCIKKKSREVTVI